MKVQNKAYNRLNRVDFGKIRYANCWEDAELLLQGLNLLPGSKVLSIGSAGDNSFSLLTSAPQQVVVVDISPVQLYLIELKREAIRLLDRNTFMGFMDFLPMTAVKRTEIFKQIRSRLTLSARAYWDAKEEMIQLGLIHQGKFERYFQLFAHKVLPLIHSHEKVNQLIAKKSPKAQALFFEQQWNTWRWRNFFKVFFSKYVMGRLGRDKRFLQEVELKVSDFILKQAQQHLSSPNAQENYMLNYALTRDFQGTYPHYLKEASYKLIQERLDQLILVQGYVEEALDTYGPFDAFNLSNIFEYLDEQSFQKLSTRLIEGGSCQAKYAYWNLMVDRIMSQNATGLERMQKTDYQSDRGFFYKRFVLEEKR